MATVGLDFLLVWTFEVECVTRQLRASAPKIFNWELVSLAEKLERRDDGVFPGSVLDTFPLPLPLDDAADQLCSDPQLLDATTYQRPEGRGRLTPSGPPA